MYMKIIDRKNQLNFLSAPKNTPYNVNEIL